MKDGAVLANAGHFNVEVDVEGLEKLAVEAHEQRHNIMGYKLPNGRRISVIAEGRLVNLASGDGQPAEIMDTSFAIQALSARYLAENTVEGKLVKVPAEIDAEVARRKLAFEGYAIDTLTAEQKKYLDSWAV
jgi:adenosylhomocysteinase